MQRQRNRTEAGKLVAIAIAEDLEHARDCQRLLKEKEIDAVIKLQDPSAAGGVLVQVGEECAQEAQNILAMRNSPEDFYEFDFFDGAIDEDE